MTGNVIVGDQSSHVGLAFDGGSNKLIVVSSGNEVVHVGTGDSDTRSHTETAGTWPPPPGLTFVTTRPDLESEGCTSDS